MNKQLIFWPLAILAGGLSSFVAATEMEVRGNVEIQARLFTEDALFDQQHSSDLSLAALPEFLWQWNNGDDIVEFIPSVRIDQYDEDRTHGDIRELAWVHVADDWESRVGIRRVFWGVTEFQHLVDVINQSDSVEDVDNEDKLGQPMVNLSLVRDWGIVDFYLLPYFRERTFAGVEGRPGLPFINADNAIYQSSDKENNLDWAVRWAQSIDEYEIALSWFEGTSREPLLVPRLLPNNSVELNPYYQQISQLGIELQANLEDALWKLEMIHNENDIEDYWALQGGVEYTQYGIMDSNADLGWLVEYGWDQRGEESSSTFQNDLFFGTRLALNDVDSTELLAGLSYDLDFESTNLLIETSRRFGDSTKISLDVRLFNSDDPADPIYLFKQDDHVQLTAQYYF